MISIFLTIDQIYQFQMGDLCSKVPVAPDPLPSTTQQVPDKLLYLSTLNQLERITNNRLDASHIPTNRSNKIILTLGGNFDPKSYVRFFLIYTFYINKYSGLKSSTKDAKIINTELEENFYNLISKTHPDPEQQKKVQQFKRQYTNQTKELKKYMLVIKNWFDAKFIIENLNQILLNSNDPKDIGHVAFPLATIFKGISQNFLTIRNKSHSYVYIVAVLEPQQKDLIDKMKGKNCCFAFSVFMRGFTDQNCAKAKFSKLHKQYKKSKSVIYFTVVYPQQHEKMDPRLNYGFYINPDPNSRQQGDIIFNVMNTFKVVNNDTPTEYNLQYGYLSCIYYADTVDRIKDIDANAIRVFDICNAVSEHYLKSQSCLFRIINDKQVSLKLSHSAITQSQAPTARGSPLNEIEAENLINNYIDDEQYDKAIDIADRYTASNLMKAKKLEVLYKRGHYDEAQKLIQKIPAEYQPKISQATQIRDFIAAKIILKKGDKATALNLLRNLAKKMTEKYSGAFEVIGTEVITAIQQVTGGKGKDNDQNALLKSQVENKAAIKQSAINMRGISTTI